MLLSAARGVKRNADEDQHHDKHDDGDQGFHGYSLPMADTAFDLAMQHVNAHSEDGGQARASPLRASISTALIVGRAAFD